MPVRPVRARRVMRLPALAWSLLAWGLVALSAAPRMAHAQAPPQQPAAPGWEFYLTPYLWVSGITGTTSTTNRRIPSQTASASFGDILSHLNGLPVMGAAELRYGRFGLLSDTIGVSLKTDVAVDGPLFSGGTASVRELLATVMPTYRVVALPHQTLDLGVGVRVVAYWTTLSFDSGLAPGFSRSPSLSWADPLLGARYHLDVSGRFGLTVYGDVGGVGGADRTWQALGTLDYRYSDRLAFHAGYRYLNIAYDAAALHINTALSGPILGATLRF